MFTRKMKIVLLLFVLFCLADNANATPRWRILDSGAIEWQIDGRLPHYDHIEMSGLKVSAVLRYGVTVDFMRTFITHFDGKSNGIQNPD